MDRPDSAGEDPERHRQHDHTSIVPEGSQGGRLFHFRDYWDNAVPDVFPEPGRNGHRGNTIEKGKAVLQVEWDRHPGSRGHKEVHSQLFVR